MTIGEAIEAVLEHIDIAYISLLGFKYAAHLAVLLIFVQYLCDNFDIDIFEYIRQKYRQIFRKKQKK